MEVPPNVEHLPARHEVTHAHASHEKLQRVFGHHPTTSLDDGLRAMAAWVRVKGARASAAFENIEIRKNLPAVWAESARPS
jgi:UDP-glucose 4-epimerase